LLISGLKEQGRIVLISPGPRLRLRVGVPGPYPLSTWKVYALPKRVQPLTARQLSSTSRRTPKTAGKLSQHGDLSNRSILIVIS
jgi:hypothetical protein